MCGRDLLRIQHPTQKLGPLAYVFTRAQQPLQGRTPFEFGFTFAAQILCFRLRRALQINRRVCQQRVRHTLANQTLILETLYLATIGHAHVHIGLWPSY